MNRHGEPSGEWGGWCPWENLEKVKNPVLLGKFGFTRPVSKRHWQPSSSFCGSGGSVYVSGGSALKR